MFRNATGLTQRLLSPLNSRCFAESAKSSLVEVSSTPNGIYTVTLNNPKKHNALSFEMFTSISSTAQSLRSNSSVRCVILNGAGKSFCSGLDVPSMVKNPSNGSKLLERPFSQSPGTSISNLAQDVGYLWRQCPFPVIAAIHGKCYGGGLQIALGADFRYATPNSEFSIMEAKWGIIPDMSGSVTLREVGVGLDLIKELAMTAKIFKGREAKEYGLVSRVVDDHMAEAMDVAEQIVKRSPDAVALTKRLFNETWNNMSEEEALILETDLQKKLLPSWNQIAASAKNFGMDLPYKGRTVG
ncbi:hypothetical protein TL16_g01084 [Triparma laevis f. inornata]|uniref:Uncharacterized protein n=1 Tax=Triparma laevis f. inornata TaxID=1714386 RepID=A0A9W7DRM9_9STRA|nr:hypothetical protein TL16_g01084 [Triparma laevis f. inornata]